MDVKVELQWRATSEMSEVPVGSILDLEARNMVVPIQVYSIPSTIERHNFVLKVVVSVTTERKAHLNCPISLIEIPMLYPIQHFGQVVKKRVFVLGIHRPQLFFLNTYDGMQMLKPG